MSDMGTVMRAFLPIKDRNDCNLLIQYTGMGTVVDMRVVCMSPNLTDVVYSTMCGYRVSGLANIIQEPMGLVREPGANLAMPFDCGFSAVSGRIVLGCIYGRLPCALRNLLHDRGMCAQSTLCSGITYSPQVLLCRTSQPRGQRVDHCLTGSWTGY
jgi:hypothetical protein